jgi:hypothetical protein
MYSALTIMNRKYYSISHTLTPASELTEHRGIIIVLARTQAGRTEVLGTEGGAMLIQSRLRLVVYTL